jgi:hypothetical protein
VKRFTISSAAGRPDASRGDLLRRSARELGLVLTLERLEVVHEDSEGAALCGLHSLRRAGVPLEETLAPDRHLARSVGFHFLAAVDERGDAVALERASVALVEPGEVGDLDA